MGVAFRYINRELLAVFLVSSIVLLVVAVGGRFVSYLEDAALGYWSAGAVFWLMALKMPEFLQIILPFSFYLAVLLTSGRLYADHEMTSLINAGVSIYRVLGWMLISALLVSGLVAYMALSVAPTANRWVSDFFMEQRAKREFSTTIPGTFTVYSSGFRVSYAEQISPDRTQLKNVFMAERQEKGAAITVWAEQGSQSTDEKTGSRFLVLKNGHRYEGTPGKADYRVAAFDTLSQKIATDDAGAVEPKAVALPTADLLSQSGGENLAEFHRRLAQPLLVLIGCICAFGLSRVKPREGRFARILPGVTLILGYYLSLLLVQNVLASGVWPSALGLWPIHGAFLVLGLYLTQRQARPMRLG